MNNTVKLAPAKESDRILLARIEKEANANVNKCYQCGKCSAGCPVAFAMDYTPRQIIRLLQLGMLEEALSAESIWICATCETCSARCPRGVDIASLMDALRREALKQGKINDKSVAAFNKAFLNGVKHFGRTFEAGVLLQHNIATGKFFKDVELGWPMMKRGKVSPIPTRIKGTEEIKKIFARAQKLGGEE